MQTTAPSLELCELRLPSGPMVRLHQDGDRFFTHLVLSGGESLTVEINDLAAAYEWYLLAAGNSECRAPSPGAGDQQEAAPAPLQWGRRRLPQEGPPQGCAGEAPSVVHRPRLDAHASECSKRPRVRLAAL